MTTTQEFKGSKYEATEHLDLAEVAKLVRADIRAAIAEGKLPVGLACSVRISRYSMGQSLNVDITAAPFVVKVTDDNEVDMNRASGLVYPWLTREAAAVLETVEEIRSAYNRDRSDIQSDYFCVRFYGRTEFNLKAAKPTTARTAPDRRASDAAIAAVEVRIKEIEARLTESAEAVRRASQERDRAAAAKFCLLGMSVRPFVRGAVA